MGYLCRGFLDLHCTGMPYLGEILMKMPKLFAVAIAALFILACIPGAYAAAGPLGGLKDPLFPWISDEHPVTVEQAKESIRIFNGDMSQEPVYVTTRENLFETYYLFDLDTVTYGVNTQTGIVEMIVFPDRMPESRVIAVSRDQALANAKEFAGRYNGFSKKSWHLVSETLVLTSENSSSYFIVFQEERDDILLTSIVIVEVNPLSGAIWSYGTMDRTGEAVSLTPAVGEKEAARIAANGIPDKNYTIDPAPGHLVILQDRTGLKDQHLVWIFTIRDKTGADPIPWDVFVDATDGRFYPVGYFPFQTIIDRLGYLLPRA